MSISSNITGNLYRGLAQTTPDAQTQAKADRKKARQAKRLRKAEGVMGAIGSFAESVASGMQAEGDRRAKLGLSGSGMAAAFSSGVSEIVDFSRLQKAKRRSALAQKLGFTPADAGSDDDVQRIIDALTDYEARQNASVGAANTTTDDGASDGDAKDKRGPFEQGGVTEPTDQELLDQARNEGELSPTRSRTGNPVLDNIPFMEFD